MTRAELERRLAPLLAALPAEVAAVYLFGSFARDEARHDSDVDLAFWRREDSAPKLGEQPYALAAKLELELGREVDLVELNHATPDLAHEVLRDGVLLLDRDPALRVRREVHARAHYFDMQPLLRRYTRAESAMTNRDLLEKKLAFIERCLRELQTLAKLERIESDVQEQRFVERELQLAIQVALDVASHIVSDERLAEPSTNAELFAALVRHGLLSAELGSSLVQAAKFRNVLVHAYVDVDPRIVRDVAENHLGELAAYVTTVRAWLDRA